jgi:hypothetical protein
VVDPQQQPRRLNCSKESIAMRAGSDREYHVERARAELDAAYRAAGSEAAAAHLRLCSMHMARAKTLMEAPSKAPPELEWIENCRPLHERCLAAAG